MLLSSFFSSLLFYPILQYNFRKSQIIIPPLTKKDVKNAIFLASLFFIKEVNNLLLIVWQKLWPVLNNQITQLFCSSFFQSRFPKQQKIAKIIPLKKLNQTSYIFFSASRLISLLSTLIKAMKSIIATCTSYLTNKYSLFLGNQFDDLKKISIVDVSLTLQKMFTKYDKIKNYYYWLYLI